MASTSMSDSSGDESGSEFSLSDSDISNEENEDGILPYRFEPDAGEADGEAEAEEDDQAADNQDEERLGNNRW